jgi:hypothetical protein
MITLETVLENIWTNRAYNTLTKVEVDEMVKGIYASRGMCKECTHLFEACDGYFCGAHPDVKVAVYDLNGYCSKFKRVEE